MECMFKGQTVRCNRRKFDRIFCIKQRSACCEKSFCKKRNRRFWEITTDPKQCPKIQLGMMTEMTGLNYKDVGNLYGCET